MEITHNDFKTAHISACETRYFVQEFVDCQGTKEIYVGEQTTVHYLAILDGTTDLALSFFSDAPESTVYVYALLLWNKWTPIKAQIHSHLRHNSTTAHMHLISFLPTDAHITLDGGVTIHPDVMKWSGHLLEENIILGEWIQIKTLPMLDVQSNDVSASHGARIEKLDAKKLFYAQSRGLSESEAKWLLVHGYIHQCFSSFLTQAPELEHRQEELFTALMKR